MEVDDGERWTIIIKIVIIIKTIATNNGYDKKTVKNLFEKANSKLISQKLYHNPLPKNKKSSKRIPFIAHTSSHVFRTIKNKLDRSAKLEKCGVYMVRFEDC